MSFRGSKPANATFHASWDDRSIKLFRVFTHPDKDRLYCDRANVIRAWLREEMAEFE